MSNLNQRCLDTFPGWLKTLNADIRTLLEPLESGNLDVPTRKALAGGINYLFKSLDLVPDGIDDIGYLDDAFVVRMAAEEACECGLGSLDETAASTLQALAKDTALIRELLGEALTVRFTKYTRALSDGSARGRTVDEIIEDPGVAREFFAEVNAFIDHYEAPSFSSDEKNLIKLKAFMDAKLPR